MSVSRRLGLSVATCLICLLSAAPAQSQTAPPAEQDKPVGEAPEERKAGDIFLRGQRVLLGRGEVVVDFGQFYSRSDDLQLALSNDNLALATLEQSVFTTLLIGRVGIMNETEIFGGTTFHRQRNRLLLGTSTLADSDRSVLGDVSVGIRRTLFRESVGRPDVIATFSAQIPTGNTPYALGGGLTFVKSVDPVILFAALNYQRSLRRELSDGRRLQPGNAADVTMGYGLALNDSLAISTAASALFTRAGRLEDTESRRVDAFSLHFALTSALARGLYIEPSVGFGLSGPARTFSMGITVPYSF